MFRYIEIFMDVSESNVTSSYWRWQVIAADGRVLCISQFAWRTRQEAEDAVDELVTGFRTPLQVVARGLANTTPTVLAEYQAEGDHA